MKKPLGTMLGIIIAIALAFSPVWGAENPNPGGKIILASASTSLSTFTAPLALGSHCSPLAAEFALHGLKPEADSALPDGPFVTRPVRAKSAAATKPSESDVVADRLGKFLEAGVAYALDETTVLDLGYCLIPFSHDDPENETEVKFDSLFDTPSVSVGLRMIF